MASKSLPGNGSPTPPGRFAWFAQSTQKQPGHPDDPFAENVGLRSGADAASEASFDSVLSTDSRFVADAPAPAAAEELAAAASASLQAALAQVAARRRQQAPSRPSPAAAARAAAAAQVNLMDAFSDNHRQAGSTARTGADPFMSKTVELLLPQTPPAAPVAAEVPAAAWRSPSPVAAPPPAATLPLFKAGPQPAQLAFSAAEVAPAHRLAALAELDPVALRRAQAFLTQVQAQSLLEPTLYPPAFVAQQRQDIDRALHDLFAGALQVPLGSADFRKLRRKLMLVCHPDKREGLLARLQTTTRVAQPQQALAHAEIVYVALVALAPLVG